MDPLELLKKKRIKSEDIIFGYLKLRRSTIWSEKRQSLGPWELPKMKRTKSKKTFFGYLKLRNGTI